MTGDDKEPEPWVVQRFTLAGRALFLGMILSFIGGVIAYVAFLLEDLPGGSYPLLLFAVPVGLACVLIFFGLAWLLERLGIRIYRQ